MSIFCKYYCQGLFFIVAFSLLNVTCFAQPHSFINTYSLNNEFGDIGISLECPGRDFILITASVVEIPQNRIESQIVKIDSTGQLVWSTVWLEDDERYVGSFQEGIVINRDSVLTTTDSRNGRGSGYLALVSTSLETGESAYSGRFDDTTGYISGDLHFTPDSLNLVEVSSRSNGVPGYFPLTIAKLSLTGNRLSEARYFDDFRVFVFRSSRMDTDGNIYISFKGCRDGGTCNPHQAWISKIDLNGEILWTKSYGYSAGNQVVNPYLTFLSEDRLALSWTRDTNNFRIQESPPIIYILDREGEKLDSIAFHGNWRTLSRIQTAANGDIIGAGYAWTDIGYTGWMIRVTSEAELVWERYIQDNRLAENVYTELRDVAESADGSVAAAGFWSSGDAASDGGNTLRTWLVKLDADGCLEPGCISDTIHLMRSVATEEVAREPGVSVQINPNPVEQQLHFEVSGVNFLASQLRYTITGRDGRILQSGPMSNSTMNIDVNGLPSGMHFFSITSKHRFLATRRFIKR